MRANQKLTDEHITEILARVQQGHPYSMIARDYSVSDTRIYQLAKAAGVYVPRRPRRAVEAQG